MTKVQHPTITKIVMDVSDSKLDDWLTMGWQRVEPIPIPPIDQVTPRTAGFKPKASAE